MNPAQQNEAGTFQRFKAHRGHFIDPEVKRHHGRIFKLMGDGLLAEFGNVVDAKPLAVQAPDQDMRWFSRVLVGRLASLINFPKTVFDGD